MRRYLYFLGAIAFDEPSPRRFEAARSLIIALRETPLSPACRAAVDGLEQQLHMAPALACEHARLFVLGNPTVVAHPYAAYWLEGRLLGDVTIEVARRMQAFGFSVTPDSGLLPDHIVSELEFLALLAEQDTSESREAAQSFITRHMRHWVPGFIDALRQAEPSLHPFYSASVDLLDALMACGVENRIPARAIQRPYHENILN
ncbi:TorD/DmsD family molecular chaperone [Alkalilimnicola ehrlichii]|uniref:TorD/DmsD family molecular chaperone n=1 Tax=Alkalilimnicola ehrlichii TaxID=351052 RepID=UPI003BA1C344